MEKKDFAIKELKHLTNLPGYCLATNQIMRDVLPVKGSLQFYLDFKHRNYF